MHLIVGLGNPGPKYLLTRHNIGFMCLDFLAESMRLNYSKKWQSEFCKTTVSGEDVVFLKPQTYMNLSGGPVRACMDFFKITPQKLLVIQDDISMPFGALRLQKNRSAGGHNGIKDITEKLSTQDYSRLKIGVDSPKPNQAVDKYVLENFNKEEITKLSDILLDTENLLKCYIEKGLDKTANLFNRKSL